MNDQPWETIFKKYEIDNHDFECQPYIIKAKDIKNATKHFENTNEKEVRILCKQDSREDRPQVFIDNQLFLLPIKNGEYAILKGEGYVDIPSIEINKTINYTSKLNFIPETSNIGNSEMQHLDFAYASSIIRHFMNDESLVLTIRGRKYTPQFSFRVGKHNLTVKGVQTEIDAGYEGKNQVVLVEAKNTQTNNVIIRQLFYPFRQWQHHTKKKVKSVFFEKRNDLYSLWLFEFADINDYNSITLVDYASYRINFK